MSVATTAVERWTNRAGWDRLVADSPQGSIFCRSAFLDALDVEWEAWVLPGPAGPRAAALLFRDGAGTIQRAPLPFCLYQGILLPSAVATGPAHRVVHETLEAVEELIQGVAIHRRMSWCLHPAFGDLRPLSWFHHHDPTAGLFRLDVRYTGIIAVGQGLDAVLAGARSVRRQEYRKAAERFRVEPSADLDLLDRLHGLTFARQGLERSGRERRLLASIAAAALRHGFGDLLVARDGDGNAAGAVLFLFDGRTAYYLVAANDPTFRSAGVSTLLFLRGLERGLERGVERVDVVGMNSPSRGDFKTSFGAVPTPYFVAHWDAP